VVGALHISALEEQKRDVSENERVHGEHDDRLGRIGSVPIVLKPLEAPSRCVHAEIFRTRKKSEALWNQENRLENSATTICSRGSNRPGRWGLVASDRA
jgi:hypothetical protein